ncbi:hypothetical protein EUBVEN_00570 [Eubacterium ventriosum ATCC 27560]|uniref:Uncharacterized protein n=1 Tax=Eubacterium ventriosum ATCC 27560 TaxID=411463 RepID=A5Z4E5_9FIRM|nr:hypothetical protein EUBVEN_00570 [Eubacterium ventriosum ATCC 27560]
MTVILNNFTNCVVNFFSFLFIFIPCNFFKQHLTYYILHILDAYR